MISICIKDNDQKLQDYIENEIKKSKINDLYFSKHCFKIYKNIIVHYKGNEINNFFDLLSKIIANSIIIFYEPQKIKNLINFDYFYFSKNDKKIIFDEYKILLKKISEEEKNYKYDMIFQAVNNYLRNNKVIVLEGFINFRLKNYIAFLRDSIGEAVNQFIIDKEYIEFVNLLKDYVDSRVPNNSIINLIYINSEAILLSDNGEIINLDKFDSKYLSDISFCNNDYVLNTLIGLLPNRIMLHLISPKDNFIKTVELIFGDKVKLCSGCELCSAYKILNLK